MCPGGAESSDLLRSSRGDGGGSLSAVERVECLELISGAVWQREGWGGGATQCPTTYPNGRGGEGRGSDTSLVKKVP